MHRTIARTMLDSQLLSSLAPCPFLTRHELSAFDLLLSGSSHRLRGCSHPKRVASDSVGVECLAKTTTRCFAHQFVIGSTGVIFYLTAESTFVAIVSWCLGCFSGMEGSRFSKSCPSYQSFACQIGRSYSCTLSSSCDRGDSRLRGPAGRTDFYSRYGSMACNLLPDSTGRSECWVCYHLFRSSSARR